MNGAGGAFHVASAFGFSTVVCVSSGKKGYFVKHVNEHLHTAPCFIALITVFVVHCFWARFVGVFFFFPRRVASHFSNPELRQP